MRKLNILMIVALAIAVLGTMAFTQIGEASNQDAGVVGVVVAYVPGQSITVVDQNGSQHEFQLSSSLKILPPKQPSEIALGSFVTIIAPNSISSGKQVAVGIVIHPKVPDGWKLPDSKKNVVETGTAVPTKDLATGTLATSEPTKEMTTETATATPTAIGTIKETATPTATPLGGTAKTPTNESFIQWLTSLIRQALAGQ